MFGDCTWRNLRLKRRSRQNDSHGIRIVTQRNSLKGNNSMPTVFWKRKNQAHYSSGTHFVPKNKEFDNGDSLKMTEQEDISPCYITKRRNLKPLNKLCCYVSLYLPDFDASVWRLPWGTQASYQVCSRGMSQRRLRKFFWIMSVPGVSSTSPDIASFSERRRVVLLMESVQISPCGFVSEREDSWCYEISSLK